MTEIELGIAIIDNDIIQRSDAIILLEGDGLFRVQKAVSLYKQGWADIIVFSGGITDHKYGSFPFTEVLPHILSAGVPESYVIHEGKSSNTREQAIEVLKMADDKRWKKLILVASHEHQYRAYLTFLRMVMDFYNNMIIYNAPARNHGWFNDSGWGTRYERIENEFARIEKYSKLGHLATFEEVIKYQRWKELQK